MQAERGGDCRTLSRPAEPGIAKEFYVLKVYVLISCEGIIICETNTGSRGYRVVFGFPPLRNE